MRHLQFTPLAEQDLEDIADFIAQDNPERALTFIQALRSACLRVATHPEAYRLRPELGEGVRACPFRHYRIFYRRRDAEILILRIFHAARLPPDFDSDQAATG